MLQLANPQAVNWGSWFSVVKLSCAFPNSFWGDGLIRSIYIHGFVVEWVDSWFSPPGLRFGGVFVPFGDDYY